MPTFAEILAQATEVFGPDAEQLLAEEETLHLVRSAANARRLFDAMADADAGKLTEVDPTAR